MEDKYLASILEEIKDGIKFGMERFSQTKNSKLLDILIEEIEKYIKMVEGSGKKSESITEFCAELRGMMDEIFDEKERNSEALRLL
jgi:uncharacterized protein YjgD (DUF1641 family)